MVPGTEAGGEESKGIPTEKESDGQGNKSTESDGDDDIDINGYRKLVRNYIDNHLYTSALFWADKVVSLSNNAPIDVYWLAQCMYLLKQYRRAAFVIQSRGLDKTDLAFRYLAAKCLLEAREFTTALAVISPDECYTSVVFNSEWSRLNVKPPEEKTTIFPNVKQCRTKYPPVTPGCSKRSMGRLDVTKKIMDYTDSNVFEPEPIALTEPKRFEDSEVPDDSAIDIGSPISSILFLKGRIYQALDKKKLAYWSYKRALMEDVYCFDAFDAMVKHQMLSADEEEELIQSLPFSGQCKSKEEELFVISIYESLLRKYSNETTNKIEVHPKLQGNLDIEVSNAERLYYACVYSACFEITSQILEKDPHHSTCLPLHIACLVELKKANDLFQLAHELVELRPELAVSWFAVGCYYYLKGKTDTSRRYLARATSRDRNFGPAWLAYGHTFAIENEHDQAVVAYFKAAQLMKGGHLPLLYAGLECGLTSNFKLGEKFLQQAKEIAPNDPFLIHEMGVVAYQKRNYKAAENLFEEALARVKEINEVIIAEKWEPLYNNLGHTCRKLKKYDKALEYHKEAMLISPLNASSLASIGFVQALTGQLFEAAESFHKAMGLRRDDNFSSTMLAHVMDQLGLGPLSFEEAGPSSALPADDDSESMAVILTSEKLDNPEIGDIEGMETQETPQSSNQ